jgi:CubicO group peptidase (beta-lactamase class C family)
MLSPAPATGQVAVPQAGEKVNDIAHNDPNNSKEFEIWLEGFLAGYTGSNEALSLGIVLVKDGKVLFQKGYGYADYEGSKPVIPDQSIFRAASISKLFTATAVMQLREQGKIDLDADVNLYLKSFKVENNFPAPVTARHLLTHTSGIDERLIGNAVASPQEVIPLGEYFSGHRPRITRPPGKQVIYSNHGMALAGHLVEAVSGISFAEYVEKNIFEPLGMEHSSFRQPYPAHLAPNVVPSGGDEGALLLTPAGAMISTVADMARFMIAHLNGGMYEGTRILSEQSVQEMHRQQFSGHPKMPGVGLAFFENYTNGRHNLFHTGLSGHQSVFFLMPEEKLGLYVVHSAREGGAYQELRKRFIQAFIERYYPASPSSAESRPLPEEQRSSEAVTGWYRPNLFPRRRFEKVGDMGADTIITANDDGALLFRYPPLGLIKSMRMVEVEPLLFVSDEHSYVTFRRDDRGNITQMFVSGDISDPLSFDSLKWYESGMLHAGLGALGALIFLSFWIIFFSGRVLRVVPFIRRRLPQTSGEFRLAWYAAGLVSLLVILSPVFFVGWYVLSEPALLPYRLESAVYVSLSILLLAALLGLSLPVFSVIAWKKRHWTMSWRVYYSLVSLTALLMLPFLYYWSLLNFMS